MTKEQDLNADLRQALAGYDPCRVENSVGPGTPDINHRHGWIESKVILGWPVRDHTVVAVRHYVKEQRGWHVRRRKAGGRVHVALRVHDTGEFFMLDALLCARHLGVSWTRADVVANAALYLKPWRVECFQDWFAAEVNPNKRTLLHEHYH